MVNKWRDVRDSKNIKTLHEVATGSATQIPTQCSAQGSLLSAVVVRLVHLSLWSYTSIHQMYTHIPEVKNVAHFSTNYNT